VFIALDGERGRGRDRHQDRGAEARRLLDHLERAAAGDDARHDTVTLFTAPERLTKA
jgi:hypothetical protein